MTHGTRPYTTISHTPIHQYNAHTGVAGACLVADFFLMDLAWPMKVHHFSSLFLQGFLSFVAPRSRATILLYYYTIILLLYYYATILIC
jgi:hypothetical protein